MIACVVSHFSTTNFLKASLNSLALEENIQLIIRLKMLRRNLLLFFVISITFSGVIAQQVSPEDVGISSDRLARYEDYLTQEIENGQVPGAVSMIIRKGEIAHYKALGYNDIKEKTPMKKDQIFFIQSMTKPIISTAFMMLYEEGHFFLNDPVEKYLPQFKDLQVAKDPADGVNGEQEPAEEPIRMWHLLTHTAGLSHGLGATKLDRVYAQNLYYMPHKTIEDRVNAMIQLPLMSHPGEQWYYSASPEVLSLLVEHFSGMSTAAFLEERIFKPLDMDDTGYNVDQDDQGRVATLHFRTPKGKLAVSPRQTPTEGNTVFAGANGLFSTAEDYLKFCQMILDGGQSPSGQQLLSPKTIELMSKNHVGDLYQAPGYGFGLGFAVVDNIADARAMGSAGELSWSGAFCTYFFINPKEEMAAVLMTQISPYNGFYGDKLRQMVYQTIME